MRISLQQRLVRWLKNHPGYHASGDLQRLVVAETTYTPRTAVRRLEELAEAGTLEVKYVKGHAYYRAKLATQQSKEDRETMLAYHKELCRKFDSGEPVFSVV